MRPEELVDFVGHGVVRVVREVRPGLVAAWRERGREGDKAKELAVLGDDVRK